MEETQLIHQLRNQDEAAFRQLFDCYAGMVYNTALHFLQNPEDAEDVAQEVFVEVSDKIEKFKAESSLKTWIYRITCNKALEQIRKAKRKKRFGFLVSIDGEMEYAAEQAEENNGESLLRILKYLIGQLPENQQVAFTLHHMDGLSYEEMTGVMDMSLSAVESLMFRAKKTLKKRVTELNERRNEQVQFG